MTKRNGIIMLLAAIMFISSAFSYAPQADAASAIIVSSEAEARKIGSSFTTTTTLTRKQLVQLEEQVARYEKDQNLSKSFTATMAATIITYPLAGFGVAIGSSAASFVLSSAVANTDLGSKAIAKKLKSSTAKKFKISIKYVKKTRGRDVWYQISSAKVTPVK